MRLIMFGSRTWSDAHTIARDLSDAHDLGFRTLVHGACPSGADYMAHLSGQYFGFKVERHPADWEAHGKAAGPLRNQHMVALGAELAIGYRMAGESRGTDNMAQACERHGIVVVRRGWGWA